MIVCKLCHKATYVGIWMICDCCLKAGAQARREMREACAVICDLAAKANLDGTDEDTSPEELARRIRALGDKP